MNENFPVAILSYREQTEITCGRGCNCYCGSIPEKSLFNICFNKEDLIKYIANLDFDHVLISGEHKSSSVNNYAHYIIGLNNIREDTNYETDLSTMNAGVNFDESIDINHEIQDIAIEVDSVVKNLLHDLSVKIEQEKKQKEEQSKKDAEQQAIASKIRQEERERSEYKRLKIKFEGEANV